MRKFLSILASILSLAALAFVILVSSPVTAQEVNDHVAGQVLVKFKDNTPKNVVHTELRRHGARVVEQIEQLDVRVLSVPERAEERVAQALSRNPNVEYAELNHVAYAFVTPNDTYFSGSQWGLENTGQTIVGQVGTADADIDASTAWDTTSGSASIKVAILDTGIDQDHADLSSKVVASRNFSDSSTLDDVYGHGTHVGGIVAAITDNGVGVAGGCPQCVLMNGKVLNDSGSGANSWIANGITWATDNGAKVINLSLGSSAKSTTLERAVNYAWNRGVVVVAAAGNSANPSKTYPGAYNNVIAVAATDNKDQKASFSSYGAKWVDVAAPGAHVFSTWNGTTSRSNPQPVCDVSGCYKYASGTSMATPMTAATAALVWSTSHGTSASTVRNRVQSTADRISGTGTYWIHGRINASRAVAP